MILNGIELGLYKIDVTLCVNESTDRIIEMIDRTFDACYTVSLRTHGYGITMCIGVGEFDGELSFVDVGTIRITGNPDVIREVYGVLVNREYVPHSVLSQMSEDRASFDDWCEHNPNFTF